MKNVSSELFLIIKILREVGGRGVQDGEHVYARGCLIFHFMSGPQLS